MPPTSTILKLAMTVHTIGKDGDTIMTGNLSQSFSKYDLSGCDKNN
jgi:hypothetical protein